MTKTLPPSGGPGMYRALGMRQKVITGEAKLCGKRAIVRGGIPIVGGPVIGFAGWVAAPHQATYFIAAGSSVCMVRSTF